MKQVKPSSFDIGRKGFLPSQPVLNLDMCHLHKVHATLANGFGN